MIEVDCSKYTYLRHFLRLGQCESASGRVADDLHVVSILLSLVQTQALHELVDEAAATTAGLMEEHYRCAFCNKFSELSRASDDWEVGGGGEWSS